MAYIPSFAYSSTVFFSPTLKPSVFEATRSSSADELAITCTSFFQGDVMFMKWQESKTDGQRWG